MSGPRRGRWMRDLEHRLERRSTRGLLAACIIISVLPLRIVDQVLAPALVVVFSVELLVRIGVHRRTMRREGGSPWAGRLLLAVDFLAILSFLPWSTSILPAADSLRLLRLVRLILLVRYGAQIARDGWAILTRRERLRHFGLLSATIGLVALLAAVLLVHLRATTDWDGDGTIATHPDGRGLVAVRELVDVAWWCFRQLESGDNLVRSLHEHPLVVVVSLGLTAAGLFIFAFIIGIGASVLEQLVVAERQKPPGLRNHSVIVGPVHSAEAMIRELARLYAKNRWIAQATRPGLRGWLSARRHGPESRMALLGREEEPPPYIYDAELRTATYRQGDPADPSALARVDARWAKRVIVLAHPVAGPDADAVAISSVMAIRQHNQRARIYVELQSSGEVSQVAASCGGDRTYPLEMPRLIGLFLCQHLVVPGVDRLYRELLTADGSEIYTHVVNQPWEFAAIARLGEAWKGPVLRWEELMLRAWEEHHVILFGAFLGDRPQSVSAEKLVAHINPFAAPEDERLAKLGAVAGGVPAGALRGLVGLSPTYGELRSAAMEILDGVVPEPLAEVAPTPEMALVLDDGDVQRVLVLGHNDALPSMLRELLRFVRGARVVVVTVDGEGLCRRMARLPALERREVGPGVVELTAEHGGVIQVVALGELELAEVTAHAAVAAGGPYDAVVFLSDPGAADPDARTSMRVLQLSTRIERGELPVAEHLHVLIEVASPSKGALVAPRLERLRRTRTALRTTLVSTQVLKNYFMVHSAFVPGLPAVYEELLSEFGQEFIRLRVVGKWPAGRTVAFRDLLRRLSRHRLIPLAVEHRDGSVTISPHPDDPPFDAPDIVAIYAVGDSATLTRGAEIT